MRIFAKANVVYTFAGWLAAVALFGAYIHTDGGRAQAGLGTNRLASRTSGPATALVRPSPAKGAVIAAKKSDVISPVKTQPATAVRSPQSHRFLGWNFARKQRLDYLKQFLRKKADVARPMPRSYGAQTVIEGPQKARLATNQFSLNPPTLPGFNFRASLPADLLPTGVATGDLNGDGKIDWVVSNGGSNNVWVYIGKGDGTAALPTIVPLAGQSPTAVALADLRGLGILDLVVAE